MSESIHYDEKGWYEIQYHSRGKWKTLGGASWDLRKFENRAAALLRAQTIYPNYKFQAKDHERRPLLLAQPEEFYTTVKRRLPVLYEPPAGYEWTGQFRKPREGDLWFNSLLGRVRTVSDAASFSNRHWLLRDPKMIDTTQPPAGRRPMYGWEKVQKMEEFGPVTFRWMETERTYVDYRGEAQTSVYRQWIATPGVMLRSAETGDTMPITGKGWTPGQSINDLWKQMFKSRKIKKTREYLVKASATESGIGYLWDRDREEWMPYTESELRGWVARRRKTASTVSG